MPTDLTGPTGIVTHNTYDTSENLTSTIADYSTGSGHLNLTTSFAYTLEGDVWTTVDPRGSVTISTYDFNRRKVEDDHHDGNLIAGLNAASKTIYDDVGRVTDEQVATAFSGGTVTTWLTTKHTTYTPTSKVDTVTDADGKVTDSTYDDGDRILTVADPLNRRVHYAYCAPGDANCAANQVKTEYRAWQSATGCSQAAPSLQECYRRVTYKPDGEMDTLKDANGNTTVYDYDKFIRQNKTIFPDSTFELLGLDENGNVTSRKNRAGQTLTYSYDDLDDIRTKTMPVPSASDMVTTWTYLLDGRIDMLSDSNTNSIDYGYDTAARLNQVINHINGFGANRTISYLLDANGNRTKLTWPVQDVSNYYVGYCYDSLNRMTVATENATDCATNKLATYAYDSQSRRTNLTYAGTGAQVQSPVPPPPTPSSYSAAGDLLSLAHVFPGGTSNNNTYTWDYTDAHQTNSMAVSNSAWHWQPSANNSTAYTVNTLNQYATVASVAQSYDGNGNLTGDGTTAFTYDAENRLLTACRPIACTSPTLNATYAYDPLGRRTKKSGTGVTTTYFLSDGTDEIAEYDTSKTVVTRIVPGPAIDQPIAIQDVASGTKKFFHTDKQGSVVAMSDSSGAMVEGPYTYDPYGNCFAGSSPCSAGGEPYRFTGRRLDPETGFYYYRARYYDPKTGRFPQTDGVGYKADLNLYTYVGNDPVDRTDPTGKDCDAKDNTVTCTETPTGSRIPVTVTFERPKGWPQHISSSTLHHHLYDIPRSTRGGPARAARLSQAEAKNPTPGNDRPASPRGTLNDATPPVTAGAIRGLADQPGFPPTDDVPISPVKSYADKNSNVFNVTQPGHPLFPGIVLFTNVTDQHGNITMHAIGEGAGWPQDPESPTAPPINNVWIGQLKDIDEGTP